MVMRHLKHLSLLAFLLLLLLSACGTTTQTTQKAPPHTQSHTARVASTPSPTVTPTLAPTLTPDPTPVIAVPTRLIVPVVGINAPIENVGIASNGDLQTPQKNPWDGAGWYSNGPRPGEEGSAVINGHLDRPGGYPATFWNLRYLVPGNIVMVQNAQGQTLRFRVLRVASYPPQQAPLQEIFATTGGVYLNLITCAGTWIPAQHQTTLRLVVYTVLA